MFLLLWGHIPQSLSPRRIHAGTLAPVRARPIHAAVRAAILVGRRTKRIRRMRRVRIPWPVVRVPLLSGRMCRRMKTAGTPRPRRLIAILSRRAKCACILCAWPHAGTGETRPAAAPLRRGRLRRKPDRERDR